MSKKVSIQFHAPLQVAYFIERPNRFVIRCRLESDGKVVAAHLPDPGRLKEILIPGRKLWLHPADSPGRKTKWSAKLSETPEGNSLISLDSTLPNDLIGKALGHQAMEEFSDWSLVRPEYTVGDSRFDFLLSDKDGNRLVLEVKSVTLAQDRVGLFPDAITKRGRRHVSELIDIGRKTGWKGAILFVAQRSDIDIIRAAPHIDPDFAKELAKAKKAGVFIFGRRCHITLDGISLGGRVPVR